MELTVGGIIQNGINKGIKYLVPLLVNVLLWLVTIWIPYLNVGTTIGLAVGVMTKIARDEELGMAEIFDPKYRKRMGEFFLTYGFLVTGVTMGMLFMIIPAYVIGIAWMLAIPLVIDKGLGPIDALTKSNELTYGKKWVIFGGLLILEIILYVALAILLAIFNAIGVNFLTGLVVIAGVVLFASIMLGAFAFIYGTLVK